jgi:hypothetical protein
MFYDSTNFAFFCIVLVLLALMAYRHQAFKASLPKPKNPIGF